ncbi:MAG: hypothetical protein HC877_14125 [Thioploca sp.]|nr:hypothetical protein [Thioploca sp.]
MKFLVDAQLPRRLVYRLQDIGFKAIHTLTAIKLRKISPRLDKVGLGVVKKVYLIQIASNAPTI